MRLRGNENVDIAETLPMVDFIIGDWDDVPHDEWWAAIQASRDELADSSDECTEPEPF